MDDSFEDVGPPQDPFEDVAPPKAFAKPDPAHQFAESISAGSFKNRNGETIEPYSRNPHHNTIASDRFTLPEPNIDSVDKFINKHVNIGDLKDQAAARGETFNEPEFRKKLADRFIELSSQKAAESPGSRIDRIASATEFMPLVTSVTGMIQDSDFKEANQRFKEGKASHTDLAVLAEAARRQDVNASRGILTRGAKTVADLAGGIAPYAVFGPVGATALSASEAGSGYASGDISALDAAKQTGQAALTNTLFAAMGGVPGFNKAEGFLAGTLKPYAADQAARELGAGLGLNKEGGLPSGLRDALAGTDTRKLEDNLITLGAFAVPGALSKLGKAVFPAKPEIAPTPEPAAPEAPAPLVEALKPEVKTEGFPKAPEGEPSVDIPADGVMPSAEQRTNNIPQIDFKPPANTIMDGLKSVFAPASRGKEAGEAAGIMRENLAERERKTAIAQAALAKGKAVLDKLVVDAPDPATRTAKFTEFTDAIEHGKIDSLPDDIKPIAQTIREQTDQRTEAIRERGMLKTFIENYMGHIWNRGGTSPEDIGKILGGRRPLAGSEAFKKERYIPTFSEGIEMGLEPASWNPVELSLLKLREMDKAITAFDISKEFKDQGLMKFIRLGAEVPEGWKTFNDKMSRVFFRPEEGPGPVLAGNYYVPETVGKLIDNHLSPGLMGNKAYDAFREYGGVINQFQLGFSAFHLGFVTMDTQTSAAALALQKASSGNFSGAARELPAATIPLLGPIQTFMKGSKVLREYYKPGSQGAETAEVVNQLIQGGGRAKMDAFYGGTHIEAFRKALKAAGPSDHKAAGSALYHAIPAISEAVSKPVMEYVVPRMKVGVFMDLAKSELERTGASTPAERRAVLGKAWDSVENRLGQMTYDNIFWNRILKDSLMASVRSVGWNAGTIREVGGGIKDIPASALGIAKGQGISPRTAYLIALPAVTAIYGAMYQYLATGEGPKEIKDLFFPRTGRKRPDGTDDRVSLPSYMRDIAAATNRITEGPFRAGQNLWTMAKHKLHPALATVAEMFGNEDYYGRAVLDPKDKAVSQSLDMAKHIAMGFEPFVSRSFRQQKETGANTSQAVQGFFGITPAPAYVTRTDEEQTARESKMGSFQTPLEKLRRERYGKFTPLMDKLGAMPGKDAFEAVKKTANGTAPIPRDLDPEAQQAVNDFLGQQAQHAASPRPQRKLGETTAHYIGRIEKWHSDVDDAKAILEKSGVGPAEQRRMILQYNRSRALKAMGR